jgi:hypothetical protein
MPFVHGKSAYVLVEDGSGSTGTDRDISAYCDNVSHPFSVETAETTTFGKSHKTYIGGLRDTTVSISGKWDATLDGYLAGSSGILGYNGTRTMAVGPAGSTAGNIKYTFEVIMTSYEVSAPVGDVVTFSAEFQVSDTPTRGTF